MKTKTSKLALTALFLAIGFVLPLFTGQIPQIGKMLLPMHIPVMLCGLICGWKHGLVLGIILPLARFAVFGVPVIFPTGIAMMCELATYGFVLGYLYSHSKWQCVRALYRCMIISMLLGRAVLGLVEVVIFGLAGSGMGFAAFFTAAFVQAVPGVILQLILIPAIMVMLDRTKLVPFKKFC